MALNFTNEVLFYFITAIPQAVGSIILFYQYFRLKYKHFIICALIFLCLTSWEILKGMAILLFSFPIATLSVLIWIPTTFCIALFYDIVNRESIGTVKMMLISFFSTILIFLSLDPKYYYTFFYSNGDLSIFIKDSLLSSVFSLILIIMILVISLGIKFLINAPKALKSWVYFANIGIFFQQVMAPLITAMNINQSIPAFSDLFFGSGTFILALVYAKQPKLGFLLPFKASKLTIIETEGSISLYTHIWNKQDVLIDGNLFSGMVSALSQFIKEAIQKGNLREIHLDEGILILKESIKIPVVFVLLATRSTASLRTALDSFVDTFTKKYSDKFKEGPVFDVSYFDKTSELVEECFPFIPYY